MKKNLKLLLSSVLVALTFSASQIHSLRAMEETTSNITLIQPDGKKKWISVDLRKSLLDLRSERDITSDNIFQYGGVDISPRDEKNWPIKNAIKDNILSLKPTESLSSQIFGTITLPSKKPDASKLIKNPELNINTTSLTEGDSLKPDMSVMPTTDIVCYDALTLENRNFLFDALKLKSALNLIVADSRDTGFKEAKIVSSSRTSVIWDGHPNYKYPDHDLIVNHSYSLSKASHELRKSGVTSLTGGASYLGIGLDMEYKSKNEMLNRRQETEIYLLATHNVQKIELEIHKKFIKASPELEEEIEKIVNNKNIESYKKLLDIFDGYGFCIPTKFVLGGQIYCEDTRKVNSVEEAKKAESSFAASVEASFVGGSFSGGVGTTNISSNEVRSMNTQHRITKLVTGGEVGLANDPTKWIASMGPTRAWRVIERGGFFPIIDFLNMALKEKCTSLISMYCKATNDLTLIALKESLNNVRTQRYEPSWLDAWLSVYDRRVKTAEKYVESKNGLSIDALAARWGVTGEGSNYEQSQIDYCVFAYGQKFSAAYAGVDSEYEMIPFVRSKMEEYKLITGNSHPRWDEFNKLWSDFNRGWYGTGAKK